jgi:hypothetical protein
MTAQCEQKRASLFLFYLGLSEMTLVNNVSSFIIDVCNTLGCCDSERFYMKLLSLPAEKRKRLLLLLLLLVRSGRQMTFGRSLRLSKLIETWTGAPRR